MFEYLSFVNGVFTVAEEEKKYKFLRVSPHVSTELHQIKTNAGLRSVDDALQRVLNTYQNAPSIRLIVGSVEVFCQG